MIPPFIKQWPKERIQALYRAQLNRGRDPFFKHPRTMIELRELAK